MSSGTRIKASRDEFEDIRRSAMQGKISAFDLMEQSTHVARSIVRDEFQSDAPKEGIAIFLHGSPARNEMTTHSDIDVSFVETVSTGISDKIVQSLKTYGFAKVEVQQWLDRGLVERYARYNLVDGNKVLDSRFVAGDPAIQNWMLGLQKHENTLDHAMRNFVFQKYYLDHYYSKRSTPEVPNVKYQEGGYRDFLFYSWFDNAMGLSRGKYWAHELGSGRPQLETALKNMKSNKIISEEEFETANNAAGFIILLRNEILRVNQNTSERNITHLDSITRERVLSSSPSFFKDYGISTTTELRDGYEKYRLVNVSIKARLWTTVIDEEQKRKGEVWRRIFNSAERGELNTINEDPIINIAMIWGLHHARNKEKFGTAARQVFLSWEMAASIACSDLTDSSMLEDIRMHCQPLPEQGYILRIVARNPNTSDETLSKIAGDESLGIYSTVAKKRIAEGLDAAIKRSS